MKDKTKYIIILAIFLVVIGGFFVLNLVLPDKEISLEERRKLEQFPELNWQTVTNTQFMSKFEDYALDQFTMRDGFRKIKAFALYNIFGQKDNNGIYLVKDNVSKIEYPLKEQSIINAANKFNKVMQMYFPDANVYYSVIPNKNYFMATENGYIDIDYDKMLSLLNDNTKGMHYINIFDSVSLEDYYKTDLHWSQDKVVNVANKLAEEMGVLELIKNVSYTQNKLENFFGVYAGQSAMNLKPDTLTYLTSEGMKNWTVKILNEKTLKMEETSLYAVDKFGGTDPYDVFMHGATPIISIENGNNPNGKELFIFRDSFSSSLAPLLAEGYSKVTLIDLRYLDANLLGNFVDFGEGNDVLFLYGTTVLNSSDMLKA